MKTIYVHGKEWFDKVNGNSYFSAHVTFQSVTIRLPFQYGYGGQYRQEALATLFKRGLIPSVNSFDLNAAGFRVQSKMDSGVKKKDVQAWGKLCTLTPCHA